MKQFFSLLFLVFSLSSMAQKMLDEGNVWTYCTIGYNNWAKDRPICEMSFMKYYINGEHEVEGKTYKNVWVEYIIYKAIHQGDDEYILSDEAEYLGPDFHIGVREVNGRVYTNANEYNQLYWDGEVGEMNLNAWHPLDGNEYVLYDFNDPDFPHCCPFLASLGYNPVVIPYVGNTHFLFIVPDSPTDGIERETHLNLFLRQGFLAYQSSNFFPDPFYPGITDIIHDLAAPDTACGKSSDGPWYDLSGRRLSVRSSGSVPSVLLKGIYIKDGKKVVVK